MPVVPGALACPSLYDGAVPVRAQMATERAGTDRTVF